MTNKTGDSVTKSEKSSMFSKICNYFMAYNPDDYQQYAGESENLGHYIEHRFREQRAYFKRRARQSMLLFHTMQIIIIVVSAIIPVINLVPITNDLYLRIISSVLASFIVIFTGILQLSKAQENWILFMSTVDSLETEYYLLSHRVNPYDADDDKVRDKLFVDRIETIISVKGKKYVSSFQTAGPRSG
jgi:hypothetical protein